MKKIMDMRVVENCRLHPAYSLLKLTPASEETLPEVKPGQFVQVAVEGSKSTFLRRPISINFVDVEKNQLWLLVRVAGEGTKHIVSAPVESIINIILPLGNGFSMPEADACGRVLLIGGGVGVAPLLQFGAQLKTLGIEPEFLLGARSQEDLLELDYFSNYGKVHISTDDGSAGEHGVVTTNSVLNRPWRKIYCCGPAPMMKAVAAKAREINADCEVSLENVMACGIGACLCCVENTVRGNVCVCTEGPVFNINELTW